jgi:uncharacterized protein YjiK
MYCNNTCIVQNAATVGNTSQKEQVSSMGATKAEKLEQEGRGLFLVPDYHLPDEVKEDIGMPNSKVAEITYSNGRRHLYAVKEERDDSGELHKKLEHLRDMVMKLLGLMVITPICQEMLP